MKALCLFFSKPLTDFINDLFEARAVIVEIPAANRLERALMVISKRDTTSTHLKGFIKIHLRIDPTEDGWHGLS